MIVPKLDKKGEAALRRLQKICLALPGAMEGIIRPSAPARSPL